MSLVAPERRSDLERRRRGMAVSEPLYRDEHLEMWMERVRQAENDRRRYEGVWKVAQSFLQGRQWVGWSGGAQRGARVVELSNPQDRERHTVNVLTQYFWTLVGKLTAEDFGADLTFRRDDAQARMFAEQAQDTLRFVLEEEIGADEVAIENGITVIQYGTSVVRALYDTTVGRVIVDEMPVGEDGVQITDVEQARQYMAERGVRGEQIEMRPLREGCAQWDVHTPFEFLPPPGISEPKRFPWIVLHRPVTIDSLVMEYGEAAEGLVEENLQAVDLIGLQDVDSSGSNLAESGTPGRLKGHVMRYTGFEMPTPEHPKGRVCVFTRDRYLRTVEQLPYYHRYQWRAGVGVFRYHRVKDRFWGIGAAEQGVGPQFQRNRSRSQQIEQKDRMGLGRVFATKNSIEEADLPVGKIGELIWLKPGQPPPVETAGVGPGPWLEAEVQMNDRDLDLAMGQRDVSLGTAPQGVSAYSAMALLAEQDDKRLGPIMKLMRKSYRELVYFTAQDVRRYWPTDKLIDVKGEDDMLKTFTFDAAKLPTEFYVSVGKGPALPRSQAAEIQLIFDIFDRSISSGKPLPLTWLQDSLKAGKALPLPDDQMDAHRGKAELENQMLLQGQVVQPSPYDDDPVHIQAHKLVAVQVQMIPGMEQQAGVLMLHVQMHELQAQMKQAALSPQAAAGLQVGSAVGGEAAGEEAATVGGRPDGFANAPVPGVSG